MDRNPSTLTVEQVRQELAPETASRPELQPLLDFLAVPGRGIIR